MIRIDAKQILDLLKQLVRTPSVNPAIDHSQDEGAIGLDRQMVQKDWSLQRL